MTNKPKSPVVRRLPKLHTGKNTLVTLLALLMNAGLMYLILRVSRFANVSRELFVKANMAALVLIAFVDLLALTTIIFKKKFMYVLSILLLCLTTGVSGYGVYAIESVEQSLENLTKTTIVDDVNVVLLHDSKASTAMILSEEDLAGTKIGIPADTELGKAVKNRMQSLGVSAEYVECISYAQEAQYLLSGEIDCAAMPKSWQSILTDEPGIGTHLDEFSVLSSFNAKTTVENKKGADKDLTAEPFTVLLEGDSDGLSDTIMMVSVNPQSMEITMTSIARDSYVPITCSGYEYGKINAAHMYGGMGCMIDTVHYLTGVDFDYYVEINFQGIVSIVDALGGIQIDNYVDFVGQSYTDEKSFHDVEMPMGTNVTLNGEQALAWVRERKAYQDGDFARQRHQQEFLKIILEKVMNTRDITTLLRLLEAAGDNLNTNLTVDQMTNFLTYAMTKSRRYYDDNSASGVFHIKNWRVVGYDDMVYHPGLDMDLYILRVVDASANMAYYRIMENLETDAIPDIPDPVVWDGEEAYEEPDLTYRY